ncbi:MAG: hypothetical protein PUD86_06145 [Methanobacteriaceae archaeon]|nr:hypothetical protein [Methanobacteriaceae archaeon]
MIYNYYDYEEKTPEDEFIKEEINTLLEQIELEKTVVKIKYV